MDWRLDKLDKRKVYFVRIIAGVPTRITQKTIKASTVNVGYRKLLFPIDIGKPSFRIKNTFYYVVDIHSGQLYFGDAKHSISPELLDSILVRNIAKNLVSGLESAPLFSSIIMILLGIGLGLALGFILGNYFPI
jgi:hypothetical protein